MTLKNFAGNRVLLLQGPVGPFFGNLAKDLRGKGAEVFKFNFNAGDWLFYPRGAQSFTGDLAQWPAVLEAFIRAQRIDTVLLFGDCRPLHACVRGLAQELGCALGVFEEGYLRPNYVTFEPVGVNGNSVFAQSLAPWLVQQALHKCPEFSLGHGHQEAAGDAAFIVKSQMQATQPVGNTFWHSAAWGMAYFFAAWLGQWGWNNALHHRPMTVMDAPWWWLSFGRKAWYKLKEYGVEQSLCTQFKKRFFLVPLQVHNDAQIAVHSDFDSVCNFTDYVMRSFGKALAKERAEGVPEGGQSIQDAVLVFKHHPMDRGHRNYGKVIKLLTRRYGLQGKALYIHDQHLPTLLRAARGVVVVNSTVGLSALGHSAPVKVCGAAIYDIPGLTFQGHLREFWHFAQQDLPDSDELQRFKLALIRRTQLNGSFYRKLPGTPWHCGVALDGQMRQRLWPEVGPQAHDPWTVQQSAAEKPNNSALQKHAQMARQGGSDVLEGAEEALVRSDEEMTHGA